VPGDDALKRAIDVVGASAALVLLSPLLAVVAVLVRLRMGSPVLFRQQRPGRNGRPFVMTKFRTMTDRRGPTGELLPDAERLTGLGRWLRRTSVDELPELLNVVHGDMSLVGPRPLLMEYLPLYSEEQARRHEVRPGITGWAQVNGRNAVTWEDKFALDVWYVDHRSTRLDLEILAKTVSQVFSGHGVSAPGHATMEPFRGSPGPGGGA
jgi:sugar transferase EpsL